MAREGIIAENRTKQPLHQDFSPGTPLGVRSPQPPFEPSVFRRKGRGNTRWGGAGQGEV